jgi:hypothetical protein
MKIDDASRDERKNVVCNDRPNAGFVHHDRSANTNRSQPVVAMVLLLHVMIDR